MRGRGLGGGGALGSGYRGPRRLGRRARGAGSGNCAEIGLGEAQARGQDRGLPGVGRAPGRGFRKRGQLDPGVGWARPGVGLGFGAQMREGPGE